MTTCGPKSTRKQRRERRLAALTPAERQDSLQRVPAYLHVWLSALDAQTARLRDVTAINGGPETWLYALALGATLRSVHLAAFLGVNTADALARFDAAVPDAKKVRDVLEHLEDYELGVGDLQKHGQRRLEFLYCSDDEGMSYIELQGVGVRLVIREAHAAVRQLVEDTGAAIAVVLDA